MPGALTDEPGAYLEPSGVHFVLHSLFSNCVGPLVMDPRFPPPINPLVPHLTNTHFFETAEMFGIGQLAQECGEEKSETGLTGRKADVGFVLAEGGRSGFIKKNGEIALYFRNSVSFSLHRASLGSRG